MDVPTFIATQIPLWGADSGPGGGEPSWLVIGIFGGLGAVVLTVCALCAWELWKTWRDDR
jgi:hypothetical protein